jgi:hypothetical protein
MNIKFSQLPVTIDSQPTDLFPILRDGDNQMTPVSAVYTFLSGDKLIDIYTKYSDLSGFYVLTTSQSAAYWNNTSNYVNKLAPEWETVSTIFEAVSSSLIFSDSTQVPGSSAVGNIVAITQENYDLLEYIDPATFYIIAS